MKTVIIALTAFFAMSTAVSAQTTTTTSKKEAQKTVYTCPMHPEEKSMEKGKCSKCGMKLAKTTESKHNTAVKGSQASATTKTQYVCTMDGATSDKPGKCPKCGMAMVEKKEGKK